MSQTIVIAIIILMFIFDLIVTILNYQQRKQPIPQNVRDVYDQEKYDKWLNYSMETMRFGLVTKTFSTLLMIILLLSGAFGWLERLTNSWFESPILRNLAFLGVYYLFNMLLGLPFDYYATFVLEEKFGFNNLPARLSFWMN